jgi:hypothetical protein
MHSTTITSTDVVSSAQRALLVSLPLPHAALLSCCPALLPAQLPQSVCQ